MKSIDVTKRKGCLKNKTFYSLGLPHVFSTKGIGDCMYVHKRVNIKCLYLPKNQPWEHTVPTRLNYTDKKIIVEINE